MPQNLYRLGLDLGTTSIGTALIQLDPLENAPNGILHLGVRIFPDGRDPKSKEPLAVTRRTCRQARRRRDRYLRRRNLLLSALVKFGFFPRDKASQKQLETLCPYQLRSNGLDHELPIHHLGRAFFHLNQRRGFKSNRKTATADEQGAIKTGIGELYKLIKTNNYRTLGEYYYKEKILKGCSVRARPIRNKGKADYPFYPDRGMFIEEFDALWNTQFKYHPTICTDQAREYIKERVIFYQRPLKPVLPGRCTLDPTQDRCSIAHPLFQKFRILQELNHLRYLSPGLGTQQLTLDQRNILLNKLLQQKEIKFEAIRKILGWSNEIKISIESSNRELLKGDETAKILASKKFFGSSWFKMSLPQQSEIVQKLLDVEETAVLIPDLIKAGLNETAAEDLAEQNLPSGYGRLSQKILEKIVPFLEQEVITFSKAVELAGYHHSALDNNESLNTLPYYGKILERHISRGTGMEKDPEEIRLGKIANPTVHIALNQLRRVVNCIIKRFGKPQEIVVEVARDLKWSAQRIQEEGNKQKENTKRNDDARKAITDLNIEVNPENMMKYKLWEELGNSTFDRVCTYTGKVISLKQLFSNEVEVEHILPFSKTYDDSMANKTLCFWFANRFKKNRTPHEAFSNSPTIDGTTYDWDSLLTRAYNLPTNKSWRFEENALERYNEDGDFVSRQLNDTAYLSRMAREYLCAICPGNKVWVVSGKITALLRNKWGLGEILNKSSEFPIKNRDHHGHHSIDALVVGLTDRSILQKISTNAANNVNSELRPTSKIPIPWPSLILDAKNKINKLVVSHRKNHGLGGALHNDTAYGVVTQNAKGVSTVHHYKELMALKPENISSIKSEYIREQLKAIDTNNWKANLAQYSARTGMRRVRITENISVISIKNAAGSAYKAFKPDGNYCYDIWENEKGQWDGKVLTRFFANQHKGKPPPKICPAGTTFIMRLQVNDTVSITKTDNPPPSERFWRVCKISKEIITLAPVHEGGSLKNRDNNPEDPFKYLNKSPKQLRELQCRLVHVDECGFVLG